MNNNPNKHIDDVELMLRKNSNFALMKSQIAHGKITVYSHTRSVAETSLAICKALGINADEKAIITGALLHDYYLYDWHDCNLMQLHGFHHPRIAMNNAIRDYQVDEKIQNIILSHMWPLTLTYLPMSKEAIVVCLADKISAAKETIFRR